MDETSARRSQGLTNVLAAAACVVIVLSVAVPVVGTVRMSAGVETSMSNLTALGVAHTFYAVDWDGRQVTWIDETISTYGNNTNVAFFNFIDANGDHPPIYLGWGCQVDGSGCGLWRYPITQSFSGNFPLPQPINFTGSFQYFGAFRLFNARPLHGYLDGRFYDPTYYPPNDRPVQTIVEPAFDLPWEWVFLDVNADLGDIPAWSSYCLSPAAMFDPDVMRAEPDGGWRDPWSFDDSFESPGLFAATYPNLKTHMLEHNWNQTPPAEFCNPAFFPGTYGGCEPYYFNHGLGSAPATLFYDMSVRLLPNTEVIAADELIMGQTGYGLWSRDTPFGDDGYLGEYGSDFIRASHHVLTTHGIQGRDTVEPSAGGSLRGSRRPRTLEGERP